MARHSQSSDILNWKSIALILSFGPILVGCDPLASTHIRQELRGLVELNPKNAVSDARKALAAGDTRILVWHGLGESLPGIDVRDVADFAAAKRLYGYRDILGFDDPTNAG